MRIAGVQLSNPLIYLEGGFDGASVRWGSTL